MTAKNLFLTLSKKISHIDKKMVLRKATPFFRLSTNCPERAIYYFYILKFNL